MLSIIHYSVLNPEQVSLDYTYPSQRHNIMVTDIRDLIQKFDLKSIKVYMSIIYQQSNIFTYMLLNCYISVAIVSYELKIKIY